MGELFPASPGRIVFRHHKNTVDVFQERDGSWYVSVQGEEEARGPFTSPGKAVEGGIAGAEDRAKTKPKRPTWKPKRKRKTPQTTKIDRKYLRLE